MLYSAEITVAASTTQASPSETILKVAAGVITRVMFRPRPGHKALLHAQVLYHEHQLYPTNPDADLHGDVWPIDWDEFEELNREPYQLKIVAWNDDDTYAHTFDISIVVLPKSATLVHAIAKVLTDIALLFSPRRIFGGGR